MAGLPVIRFRFRGRVRRLFDIYLAFKDHGHAPMHPMEVSRMANMSLAQASRSLEDTQELFVRLPKRPDGLTRYRLTSQVTQMTPEAVEALLNRLARRESLILYAVGVMLLCLFVIALVLIGPALG
ncbi:MAG: hypothetical protein H6993_17050 [Pseudomonadales bacterium]|nr:hypothetical protein [Pseudomonadales bacterium]MCP5185677.1 hypothetical protein [Pseudomonadales bacterium]